MQKSKQTKKALFSSVIALILCFSMLLGTTFAWFTDSVKSGINKIQAGNLDIDVLTADGKSIEDVTNLFNDVKLWEPGAVAYEKLTITNEGSLALKYAMSFAWEGENNLKGHKLSDVLKVAVLEADVVANLDLTDREAVVAAAEKASNGDLKTFGVHGELYPKDNTEGKAFEREIHVVIYWVPGENDNLYNANNGQQTSDGEALHIDLGVVVEATQQMYEGDSFGTDYDEKAEFPENQWLGDMASALTVNENGEYEISTPAELAYFAAVVNGEAEMAEKARSGGAFDRTFAGKTVVLTANMDLNNLPWTPIGTGSNVFAGTFDGKGYTIANLNVDAVSYAGLFGAIKVGEVKNVTIHGASIRSNHYAGALVAWGYVDVDNCHVIGADIICTPVDEDNNGDKAGALVGWTGEGCSSITNCTAKNSCVRAYRDLGGLVGMAHNSCIVTGNTVENVKVEYITAADYDASGNKNLGAVIGRFGSNVTNSGNKVSIATAEELKAAVSNGATAVIPENAVIIADLNGQTLVADMSKDEGAAIINKGTLTINGGTLANTAVNGGAVIDNKGTLTLDGVTIQGAQMGTTDYPAYAVVTSGKLIVEEGTSVLANRGAISMSNGAEVIINGGSFVVSDAADGRNMTLHTIYAYGYDSELTINGGYFEQNHTSTGGASVICPAGATINIYGGTFCDAMDDNNWTSTGNFQNYMGYRAPVNVFGGTFDDKTFEKNLAADSVAVDNGNGTWTVLPELEGATLTAVSNYSGLYTDGTNYYVYDAAGLISMRNFWQANWCGNNMWGRSYNVMADINGTGYTWDSVWVNVGSNDNDGFIFDGHGHTITGLTINGSLFGGTPNGGNADTDPGYVKDLTFDGIKVVGDHWTGVIWGDNYGDLVIENVHVVNSDITGKCNVAGLVGGTATEGDGEVYVTFKNCSVKNTTISAEGKNGQDPNGANAFISRAFAKTYVTFEGTNVSEGNTFTNENGLVGGGIYGYTTYEGGFVGTGTCGTFSNWNGITIVDSNDALIDAMASGATGVHLTSGNYTMPEPDLRGKVLVISGSKDAVIDVSAVDARDQFVTGATLVFDGVTLNFGTSNYMGFANTKSLTYQNCAINGLQFLYGENVVFENCDLDSNSAEHCVWTYGAQNINFINCGFTYGDRAVNVYLDNGTGSVAVNFNKCTFTTGNADSKGAIEINSSAFPQGASVSFVDCVAPAYGTMVGISGWDGTDGATATVTVDGAAFTAAQWEK